MSRPKRYEWDAERHEQPVDELLKRILDLEREVLALKRELEERGR